MNINGLKLKIVSEYLPLSLKYEYLKRLNEILNIYKYSSFAVEKSLRELEDCFDKDVSLFNISLNAVFKYLKEYGNFYNLDKNGSMYKWLINNMGVLIFMNNDLRVYDIINEIGYEKSKDFPIFKVDDRYILRLKEIYEHLKKYGILPVQTDREFKLQDGTYMGSFLSHNKKRIYMLKEGNEYAYVIARYYEKCYLSFSDKLNEVYEYFVREGILPYIDDTVVRFSNGEVMSYFISHNRKKLSLMEDRKAKIIMNYLDKRKGISFEKKVLEAYTYLSVNKVIPSRDDKDVCFSDGIPIGSWLVYNKRKILYDGVADILKEEILSIDAFYFDKIKIKDRVL